MNAFSQNTKYKKNSQKEISGEINSIMFWCKGFCAR